MYSQCETVIKERLRAPSTYKRISVDVDKDPLTRSEYVELLRSEDTGPGLTSALLEQQAAGKHNPTRYTLWISYDAANAYGTPIRSKSRCAYVSHTGDWPRQGAYLLEVDGLTSLDWMTKNSGVRN